MMSDIELKQCPCCGERAYSRIYPISREVVKGSICCNNSKCGLKMDFEIKPKSVLLNFDDVINGIHDAVERWNRRTSDGQEQTTDR